MTVFTMKESVKSPVLLVTYIDSKMNTSDARAVAESSSLATRPEPSCAMRITKVDSRSSRQIVSNLEYANRQPGSVTKGARLFKAFTLASASALPLKVKPYPFNDANVLAPD